LTLIVDAHEDIAWNILCYGRDYTRPVSVTRSLEAGKDIVADTGTAMLGLPEWLSGNVAVIFATLFSMPRRSRFISPYSRAYADPAEAFGIAMRQVDIYRRLADDGRFRLVTTQSDLDAVLASWTEESAERQIGLVLLMENADAIRKPDDIGRWFDEGLRIVGPAWEGTRYCGGTGEPGPLTDDGVRLLRTMQDFKLVLDTSHMAEEAFFQAVDGYEGPVIASHSNPRRYVDIDRNLSDDMIGALIGRDGVIGIVPFNTFLIPDWSRKRGDPKDATTLTTIVQHIDYVCQRAGDAKHVAIGSDFDGGFGMESTPAGIDTVADLVKVGEALRQVGYTPEDIEAVLSGNWLRILRQGLPGS